MLNILCYSVNFRIVIFISLSEGTDLMTFKGGQSWQRYSDCIKIEPKHDCERILRDSCEKSPFRVSKVLRLSMEMIEPLLEDMQALKVIFLLRDPRGIMSSRRTMGNTYTDMDAASRSLCKKMYDDSHFASLLVKSYSDRILKLKYEDIADRPIESAKQMYDFLNYPYNEADIKNVFSLTRGNATKIATHWKYGDTSNTDIVEGVDKYCLETYRITGYPLKI